jgi:hypothetical protein
MVRNRFTEWKFGASSRAAANAFVAVPVATPLPAAIGPAAIYQMAYERALADIRQRRTWLTTIAARGSLN